LQYLTIVQQCLPFLYRQKLSELDEITRRLKKKLHVVTNEGFTAPSVHLIHENENSFRSEAASHTVSNTKDGKCTETVSVSSVNEEVYEGKLVLKITNLSVIAVGCSNLSVNKNGTELSVNKNGTELSVNKNGTELSLNKNGTELSVNKNGTELSVNKNGTELSVNKNGTELSVNKNGTELSLNKNGTETSCVKVAEQNYEVPVHFCQGCENVTNNIMCSLPINNFAGLSSTSTNSRPRSNVTNSQTRLGKGNQNVIAKKTSVNHVSSLEDTCYPQDFGSGNKTSSRMCGCELGEIWDGSVSKNESNGTRLQHVDMRLRFENTDDHYWPTDYLMGMCTRHLEVDSVFNPLLFQHLLSSYNKLNISGFSGQQDVERHYQSEGGSNAEPSSETIENCSGIGGAGAHVNVTRTECLMYSPKERTHIRNDGPCINSNSGNCDVNRARTEETEENINKVSENTKAEMG